MGTSNMEAKYEGEESGWTSYLQTDVSLFSESSSTYSNCGSSKILNGMQKDNTGEDNHRLATISLTCCNSEKDEHKIVGGDGNIEEAGGKLYCNIKGEEADFNPDEELESSNYNCVRASSSTLSDASTSFTSCCFNSHIIISKKSFKPFYPKLKLHQISHPKLLKNSNHQYKRIRHIAAANCLEDTATSSPPPASSAVLLHEIEDSASSSSSTAATLNKVHVINERQEISYEESTDAVSTRFKALEALIPRLKEVQAGKGKEEEMVKVIERHVRHLELKVELLSSAWRLSQLKHQ